MNGRTSPTKEGANANVEASTGNGIEEALYLESFEWLETENDTLLRSIEDAIEQGETPDDVKRRVGKIVGPDRQPIVRRCYLAAMHIYRRKSDNYGFLTVDTDGRKVYATPTGGLTIQMAQ